MEYALPELLSRNDILRILNERHLQICDTNELTHAELLRIYKTFVMPLSQRPERSKRLKKNNSHITLANNNDYDEEMQVESLEAATNSMDIDIPCLSIYNEENLRSNRMTGPVVEKRRQRSYDNNNEDIFAIENDYQYQLSSVTKRIRINTLS